MRAAITIPLLLIATVCIARPTIADGSGSAPTPASAIAMHPLLSWRPVPWRPSAASRFAAGMRVEIDPATGEFVTPGTTPLPPGAAVRATREAGLTVLARAGGSRSVVAGNRMYRWSVASIGADGRLHADCVHSESAALEHVRADAAKVAAPEER